ncbi:glycoside hydrolase family 31 protein [Halapricum desulfuricans]|uniref:Alpha-glucosidase, family 31 of glycosyl hydrolase n=1 Tax=Halapricum desulfuricans TaxID=2841257 RepID=A0A897N9R3_9EURY|nr:glycoside hydrolase family 31 protein [Halapricum desulfuricans]QSG08065.1 Alpha-glucosidase, family 31 of glycosyl hydrolase [Halapricum desulfuricans]
MSLADYHVPEFEPVADEAAIVETDACRFTVLSSRLLRLEYAPDGEFEDRPSQAVWYRDQPVPEFSATRTDGTLEIETEHLQLRYAIGGGFTSDSLSIELTGLEETWHYGDSEDNLGGTTRTLDSVDGQTDLEPGLLSRDGWTVLDDTDRLVFDDDGWVTPRDAHDDYEDLYFFGFGHDYFGALRAYTDVAGDVPMIPRWALGNWWSRYWEYSQDELRGLMTQFRERDLPLSVCVLDMDWHVVDNPHHSGWTGWTWDDDLFPDPEGFLEWLHDEGLKATLNLHPADGVHPHEAAYPDIAEHVGIDPASGRPVEFDASDPQFLRGYFEHVINPLEDDGVDFWWIDWQQWRESPEMDGLDPLWALNHLHALDRTRDGSRPFVFSRWADVSNHRYPIGFSGDTVISWDSLSFQPFLTGSAANVQFGWWSHDIGGHFGGSGDPTEFGELYARWLQFGVFSPINRIHTSKMPYVDKRPWAYDGEVREALDDAFVRRHELVPYLYTMVRHNHARAEPPIRPLYYHHPEADVAYNRPNQYYFGSELLAAPHVREREDDIHLSRRPVWLPDGEWFDFETGERYESGFHTRYGDLDDVPVYAKAGAIVPLDGEPGFGDVEAPEALRVVAFPGADNAFDLYEDDGVTCASRDGDYATTRLAQSFEGDRLTFTIGPIEGIPEHVPDDRTYELQFRGVREDVTVSVEGAAGHSRAYDEDTRTLTVSLDDAGVGVDATATVVLDGEGTNLVAESDWRRSQLEELLWNLSMPAGSKPPLETHAKAFLAGERTDLDWLGNFAAALTDAQLRAIAETLVDAGIERLDYAGDDRLLAWNRTRRIDVTYQFATYDRTGTPFGHEGGFRHGSLPGYEVIELSEFETYDWAFTLEYDGVTSITYEGSASDTDRR